MNEWYLVGLLVFIAIGACLLIVYPLRSSLMSGLLLFPFLIVLIFVGYYFWGGFIPWQEYVQQQRMQARAQEVFKSVKDSKDLVQQLRARLKDDPQSAKGWYLLGKLYSSQNDHQNALQAFAKAHELQPDDEQYTVHYAHHLWLNNNQEFNDESLGLFKSLLQKNPKQPDALAMLAMNAYKNKAFRDAIDYWQRLLHEVPEQSEEADAIRKAIASAQRIDEPIKSD